MGELQRAVRPVDVVDEEELGRAIGGGPGVTGQRAPRRPMRPRREGAQRRQALVERGVLAARPLVAVPAAVRPLPRDEPLHDRGDPWVIAETQAGRGPGGIAVHRRTLPHAAVDGRRDAWSRSVPLTQALTRSKPCGDGGRDRRLGYVGVELRERDEAPVDAAPLVVRVERGRLVVGRAAQQRCGSRARLRSACGSPSSSSPSRAIASRRVVGDAGSSSHARVGSSIAGVEVAARAAPDGLTVRRYRATATWPGSSPRRGRSRRRRGPGSPWRGSRPRRASRP